MILSELEKVGPQENGSENCGYKIWAISGVIANVYLWWLLLVDGLISIGLARLSLRATGGSNPEFLNYLDPLVFLLKGASSLIVALAPIVLIVYFFIYLSRGGKEMPAVLVLSLSYLVFTILSFGLLGYLVG